VTVRKDRWSLQAKQGMQHWHRLASKERIVNHLRKRFGHASAERAISGSGLENIYQAVVALEGLELEPLTAIEITESALSGECELARRSLHAFCAFLGSFAGNGAIAESW
jgi:glucokinase